MRIYPIHAISTYSVLFPLHMYIDNFISIFLHMPVHTHMHIYVVYIKQMLCVDLYDFI